MTATIKIMSRPRAKTEHRITPARLKHEQIGVVKVFGVRMKEAREMVGLNQIDAAKKLGYSNSSGLAKIEAGGEYTQSIPWWLIPRASKVYGVSVDYLFAFSDDWERDPVVSQQRDVGTFLMEHWERSKFAEINAIRVLNNKLSTLELATTNAIKHAVNNNNILTRFRELNPDFDEMKMGARLVRATDEALNDANHAMAELRRFHCMIQAAKASNINVKNTDMFDYGDGE